MPNFYSLNELKYFTKMKFKIKPKRGCDGLLLRNCFLLIGLFFISLAGQSQDSLLQVQMLRSITSGPTGFEQPVAQNDLALLANIPKDLDTTMVWKFPLAKSQYFYDQFRKGNISKEDFKKIDVDELDVTERDLKHTIYGASGFKNGKKIIVLDTNNNLDFGDDERFEFDTTLNNSREKRFSSFEESPFIILHYEYFYLGEVRKREIIVKISPFLELISPPPLVNYMRI